MEFVEFHDVGFTLFDDRIDAEVAPTAHALLNILPAFGRRARLVFEARRPEDGRASFVVRADWRYRPSSPFVDVRFDLDGGVVSLRNQTAVPDVAHGFEAGRWYTFAVERSGEELVASVDGTELLRTTLQPKVGVLHVPEDADLGAFALVVEGHRGAVERVELRGLQVEGDPAVREYRSYVTTFPIGGVDHRYSVIHEAGFEAWAQANADGARAVLEAAADVYGVPPVSSRLGTVQSRGEYFAAGFARNSLGVIEEQGRDGPAPPSCHELAHNWGHLYGKRWNAEGSAELGCLAMREVDGKVLMTADALGLDPHLRERFDEVPWGSDHPLDDDAVVSFEGLPTDAYWLGFWKAKVFTLVLYRLLGAEGYRELHRRGLALGHGMDSEEMRSLAEAIAGRDLTDVFTGWVYPGESTLPIEATFSDRDGDGLGDLDELLMGTHLDRQDTDGDGHPDRHEIAAGFDPLDGAVAPPASAIVIDGHGADWSALAPATEDPPGGAGDAGAGALRHLGDAVNGALYVRVDFPHPFEPGDGGGFDSHVTIDLDLDKDEDVDYRVNHFFRLGVSNAFRTRGFASPDRWDDTRWTELRAKGLQGAFGEDEGHGFVEVSIPWDLFESRGAFELRVTGASPGGLDPLQFAPISVTMRHDLTALPDKVWTPRP